MLADGAYRLRTTRPVTVYQYSPLQYSDGSGFGFSYTNDASVLLPTNAWTGNYRVVSRNHWNLPSNGFSYRPSVSREKFRPSTRTTDQIPGGMRSGR